MNEIRLTQAIRAPRETIWRACATTAGLCGWQADEATGEIRAGRAVMLRWPALGVELELEVEEVVEQQRVTLGAVHSRLQLDLTADGVALTHSGIADGDERDGVTSSWRMSLGILAHYCEQHPDERRSVRWLGRDAVTRADTAHVFFTDEHALATWLGRGGPIGAAGERYGIQLPDGDRMSGVVLANTPGRDVALTWEEDERAALVFRTFPRPRAPGDRLVVLSWSRWSRTPPTRSRLEQLDAAHHRLCRVLGSSEA